MIRERPFNCSNLFLITVSENSFSWAKENSAFPAEAIVELSFRPPTGGGEIILTKRS